MSILLNLIRPKPFKPFILILSSMKSLKSIALFSFAFFLLVSCQKENLVNKDLRLDLESAAVQSENPGLIPDQYIVVFKDDVSQVEENANKIAKQYGAAPGFVYKHSIRRFSIKLPQAAIDNCLSQIPISNTLSRIRFRPQMIFLQVHNSLQLGV